MRAGRHLGRRVEAHAALAHFAAKAAVGHALQREAQRFAIGGDLCLVERGGAGEVQHHPRRVVA